MKSVLSLNIYLKKKKNYKNVFLINFLSGYSIGTILPIALIPSVRNKGAYVERKVI